MDVLQPVQLSKQQTCGECATVLVTDKIAQHSCFCHVWPAPTITESHTRATWSAFGVHCTHDSTPLSALPRPALHHRVVIRDMFMLVSICSACAYTYKAQEKIDLF